MGLLEDNAGHAARRADSNMSDLKAVTPRFSRRQFTLRSIFRLIAMLTIFASWCISYRLYRENQNLRQENTRLWGEVGELHVAEGTEDKLQAIGVPTTDDMVWKWHVHVPNRQNFFLSTQVGKIAEDIPDRISGLNLDPGEYLVTVAFRKDFQDRWQWFVKQEPDGGRGGLSASNVYYPSEEQVALIKGGHSSRGSYISKGLILRRARSAAATNAIPLFCTRTQSENGTRASRRSGDLDLRRGAFDQRGKKQWRFGRLIQM